MPQPCLLRKLQIGDRVVLTGRDWAHVQGMTGEVSEFRYNTLADETVPRIRVDGDNWWVYKTVDYDYSVRKIS